MGRHPKPCVVRGNWFPSQKAAARHYGVTQATVRIAKHRGRLDMLGLGTGVHRVPAEELAARIAEADAALEEHPVPILTGAPEPETSQCGNVNRVASGWRIHASAELAEQARGLRECHNFWRDQCKRTDEAFRAGQTRRAGEQRSASC